MALTTGTRLGPYEIVSPLGAGGMGEVYRARDTKLNRDVAIKILPEAFAEDADRVARFKREAQVLASLNHPNIGGIYGLEEANGVTALVLELVEGPTLADRLAPGSGLKAQAGLPLDETLTIARQIAEALEAAHEQGIVHRDLKPANIKVRPDGTVKVLDFGLAKLAQASDSGLQTPEVSQSPTITTPAMTRMGVIMGTAAYMSPEQARGKAVGKRADVWAFGCVLYEMLTGKRAFDGDDVSDTMAAVLRAEPVWAALPGDTPSAVRRLLRRCLQKDPQKRLPDIGTARLDIDEPFDEAMATPAALVVSPRPLRRRALPLLLTAAVVGVITAGGVWSLRPSTPAAPITRFSLTLPEGQQFTSTGRQVLAISPDGSKIAYIANQHLYLRSMGDLQARPIPGAETSGAGLVFSPDGQTIAFNSLLPGEPRALKTIVVNGGAAFAVCPIEPPYDMSWSSEGIVLGQGSKGILRVSPKSGGTPETLVSVKEDELAHGPQILPGGEWVLFTLAKGVANDKWDRAQIVVQSLRSRQRKMLIDGGSDARYVPTGHIVFAVGGVLYAVPFDVRRQEVTGERIPILLGVKRSAGNTSGSGIVTGTAYFSFSNTGTLIYLPGPASTTSARSNLILIDRKGNKTPLDLPADSYQAPRVSPDGKRIVVGTDDGKEAIVWIYELSGTSPPRPLPMRGRNRFPIWADDQRVAFQSDREGDLGIWWQRVDGNSLAERLTKAEEGTSHVPESWSSQRDRLLVSIVKGGRNTLWTLSMPDKKLDPFGDVHSQVPTNAVFSPDGRWVAYQSGSTNSTTFLYAEPFPTTGVQHPISRLPAHHPLWSRDGKELFYVPYGGEPVVATVMTEPSFNVHEPIQLPTLGVEAGAGFSRNYDVMQDGSRLLPVTDAGQPQAGTSSAPQIQVVLNWFEELKARVPTK